MRAKRAEVSGQDSKRLPWGDLDVNGRVDFLSRWARQNRQMNKCCLLGDGCPVLDLVPGLGAVGREVLYQF